MSQNSCNKLLEKDRKDCTEEEVKEWDQYARIVADQIAYAKFCGVPLVSFFDQIEVPAGLEYMNCGLRGLSFI